ncbi:MULTISPECIES: spermidine synthase [unclassified Novosphingobium]|uniref:spermidine synthase n=1 Tax=unclassified Novosphingobium TaxID=2644732 RepID=UPI000EE751C7|nr:MULTISPECIES: spermidine synthase [unclassified Novosphingobium]HCF24306.1 spermidine synthase [Novosphingobium sp.]HQV04876.1 spermidine synthase [Novosphingobium sp.]
MITRELLGTAQVPGGEELKLFAHGRDFMIVMGHNELMSTRMRGSEEALATMTLERLGGKSDANLLIGGYGMGFTLRAALAKLGPKGRCTVAELMPEIIAWARGPMAEVAAGCLDDPRVTLRMDDVGDAMLLAPDPFDAILLDVDNGPDGVVRAENNRLYSKSGLHNARKALVPGGILAVWSAFPDPRFTRRMQDVGFAVEEVEVRARYDASGKGKGPRHVIWFART